MKRGHDSDEDGGGKRPPKLKKLREQGESETHDKGDQAQSASDSKPAAGAKTSKLASDEQGGSIFSEVASSQSGEKTGATAATNRFPEKMYGLLDQKVAPDALCWTEQGDAIVINKKRFSDQLLNTHFHGNKMETVTRNLNRWGFKQAQEDSSLPRGIVLYSHPFFRRDKPELMQNIAKEGRSDEAKGSKPDIHARAATRSPEEPPAAVALGLTSGFNQGPGAAADAFNRQLREFSQEPQQIPFAGSSLQQSQYLQEQRHQTALRPQHDQMTLQALASSSRLGMPSAQHQQPSLAYLYNSPQNFADISRVFLEQALQREHQQRQQSAMLPSDPLQGFSSDQLHQLREQIALSSRGGENLMSAQRLQLDPTGFLPGRNQPATSLASQAHHFMLSDQQQQLGLLAEQAAALRASFPGVPEETIRRVLLEQQQQQDAAQLGLLERLIDAERRRNNESKES